LEGKTFFDDDDVKKEVSLVLTHISITLLCSAMDRKKCLYLGIHEKRDWLARFWTTRD
jgi:hypothetical protein